jgi:23S rRNA (cytidine1920-2'-O)/16S rRNA (cytidine1409-2'-O)-methyltransferase
VTLLERTNARYLKPGDLPRGIGFVSMDVSFISATLVLPAVVAAVRESPVTPLEAVVLIKPQFEAGREHVGRGGIVHDPLAHQIAIDRVRTAVHALGASASELADSPLLGGSGGGSGNREFLLYARF